MSGAQEQEANDNPEELYEGWAVVLNHEEQYSIWDTYQPVPAGWQLEGFKGKKKTKRLKKKEERRRRKKDKERK